VGREREVRHLQCTGRHGGLLPGFVSPQGEDVGENRGRSNEVGRVARCSGVNRTRAGTEQVQRHGKSFRNEAAEETAGFRGLLERWTGVGLTQYGFDQRWRGRSNLRTRHEKDEASSVDPTAQILDREQGFTLLVPLFQADVS